jgi:hypothetical protein
MFDSYPRQYTSVTRIGKLPLPKPKVDLSITVIMNAHECRTLTAA